MDTLRRNTADTWLKKAAAHALAEQMDLKPSDILSKDGSATNVVTRIDHANSALIQLALKQDFKDDILIDEELLEELKASPYLSPTPQGVFASGKGVWLTDPVDGTLPFVRKQPHWGVMLGYYDGTRLTYAAIHMPVYGYVVEVTPEQATITNTASGNRTQAVRGCNMGAQRLTCVSNKVKGLQTLLEAKGYTNAYIPSAAAATLLLATGQRSLIALPQMASAWDVAPVTLLAETMGLVACFESTPHQPVTFGPEMFRDDWHQKDHLMVMWPSVHKDLFA